MHGKFPYNIIISKDGDIDMFTKLKTDITSLHKDTTENINKIRSKQQHNSEKFDKEWDKWNTKLKIKRKPQ